MATLQEIRETLKKVVDPEIGVNIVDLGLVYDVEDKGGNVKVTATLTTPACPLGPQIVNEVKYHVSRLPGVKEVEVEITFSPLWGPEMMTEEGRQELQFIRQGL